MGAVIPFVGLALGAIGTGLSYSAQSNAAQTQAQFSQMNAVSAAQGAQQNASIQAAQAGIQQTQYENQQQAANQNATAIRQQTDAAAAAQQETVRRNRDEFARQLAAVTAQQGNSGAVIATGSPLDLLMNAADTERQKEQDSAWKINEGRAAGYRQAAVTAQGGATAGLNANLMQLQALSDVQAGREGAEQARLQGFAGAAQAAGMQAQATGNLIGNSAGVFNSFTKTPWAKSAFGI